MIRVVVDTNKLPLSSASSSAALSRVDKLISEKVIKVLMPLVVAEEWRTQRADALKTQLQKASSALAGLTAQKAILTPETAASIEATSTVIETLTPQLEQLSNQLLAQLLSRLKTEVAISKDHGNRILDAYFKGAPPFSGPKTRKDFPDAFLFEAVREFIDQAGNEPVAVVTNDTNLGKHLADLKGVHVFDTLEELVESNLVKKQSAALALAEEAQWEERMPEVVDALKKLDEEQVIAKIANSFVDKLAGRTVSHQSIPDDNGDARVSMVGDPTDLDIKWDEAADYGPGLLRIPFACASEVLLDFLVFYADAYGMEKDYISVTWADPETHRYFDAQAYGTAEVEGYLLFTVMGWLNPVQLENIDVSVDEITEVSLEEDDLGNALH